MADESGEEDLRELFEKASNFIKAVAGRLNGDELLYLYARFKQANEGPCNITRPGFFDFQGKQKWDAWKKLGDKSSEEAMMEYVEMVSVVEPDWEEKMDTGKVKAKSGMGVVVSTMHNSDELLSDDCKSIIDWCKEGNAEKVMCLLQSTKCKIDTLDENGLALIHWACDRGYEDLVKILLDNGADINLQDSDGQTPLHYAASCEHLAVVSLLLSRGANTSLTDFAGTSICECTDNASIIQMLVPERT